MGLLTPWSHVPHGFLTYTDKMTFLQRWLNTMFSIFDLLLRHLVHIPFQNKIAKQHFSHLGPLPSIDDMIKNVSLILVNEHRSLMHARPSMPTLIYVGGAFIKPAKPLPNDLQSFIDEANDGVIYFSFGSIINSSRMSIEKIKMFLGKESFY